MLDHVFTDAIYAARQSLESALLERVQVDERLHTDVLLGELVWETSYGLPGEKTKPAVRADLSMTWSPWSQSAYRSWMIGETPAEQPGLELEITMRVMQLSAVPDLAKIAGALPDEGPDLGGSLLVRTSPNMEHEFDADLKLVAVGVELAYEGLAELPDELLEDGEAMDAMFEDLGGWIASALVKLDDLTLT